MTRRFPRLSLAAALLLPTLALSSGCELLDQLQASSGIIDVFAASHGTPDEQGNLPSRNGEQLIFTNDTGWQVFVDEAYITTGGVTLLSCDGDRYDVELYWGPLAEKLAETADSELAGLGGVRASSGRYCEVLVEYAPLAEDVENPAAVGSTVYMTGSALKDGQHIDFVWRSEIAVDVTVDISEVEGGEPLEISRDQYFAKKVAVSKDYVRFFAGIDFAVELDQADIDALVADSLQDGTIARLP